MKLKWLLSLVLAGALLAALIVSQCGAPVAREGGEQEESISSDAELPPTLEAGMSGRGIAPAPAGGELSSAPSESDRQPDWQLRVRVVLDGEADEAASGARVTVLTQSVASPPDERWLLPSDRITLEADSQGECSVVLSPDVVVVALSATLRGGLSRTVELSREEGGQRDSPVVISVLPREKDLLVRVLSIHGEEARAASSVVVSVTPGAELHAAPAVWGETDSRGEFRVRLPRGSVFARAHFGRDRACVAGAIRRLGEGITEITIKIPSERLGIPIVISAPPDVRSHYLVGFQAAGRPAASSTAFRVTGGERTERVLLVPDELIIGLLNLAAADGSHAIRFDWRSWDQGVRRVDLDLTRWFRGELLLTDSDGRAITCSRATLERDAQLFGAKVVVGATRTADGGLHFACPEGEYRLTADGIALGTVSIGAAVIRSGVVNQSINEREVLSVELDDALNKLIAESPILSLTVTQRASGAESDSPMSLRVHLDAGTSSVLTPWLAGTELEAKLETKRRSPLTEIQRHVLGSGALRIGAPAQMTEVSKLRIALSGLEPAQDDQEYFLWLRRRGEFAADGTGHGAARRPYSHSVVVHSLRAEFRDIRAGQYELWLLREPKSPFQIVPSTPGGRMPPHARRLYEDVDYVGGSVSTERSLR